MRELELNQNLASDAGAGAVTTSPSAFSGKRILLVGDEPLTRLIHLNTLQNAGFDVDLAFNGSLALKKIPGGHLDAIIMDLITPDLLGVEVIREARRDRKFGGRPIYVLSNGWPTCAWAQQAAKAGASKVFDKLSSPMDAVMLEVADAIRTSRESALPSQAKPASKPEPEVLQEIPAKLQEKVEWLCRHVRLLIQCKDDGVRASKCNTLLGHVLSVVSCASAVGMTHLARLAAALEGFLKELYEKPKRFTESSIQTMVSAVEAMERLFANPVTAPELAQEEFIVALVDTKLFSRRATAKILTLAGFKPNVFSETDDALEHLRQHRTDLVIVDSQLPKINGVEFSEKVRELKAHKKTPVIRVGSMSDLKHSAQGSSNNGTEHIVKPLLTSELVLKSLSLIMKSRTPNASASTLPNANNFSGRDADASKDDTALWLAAGGANGGDGLLASGSSSSDTSVSGGTDLRVVPTGPDVGVVLIDENKKIISANDVSASMFGWAKLLGKDVEILLKGGLNNEFGRILQRDYSKGDKNERFTLRVIALSKGGPEFPASVILTRSTVGTKSCWTAVFRQLIGNSDFDGNTAILQSASNELKTQNEALTDATLAYREEVDLLQKERSQMEEDLHEQVEATTNLERQLAEKSKNEETLLNSLSDAQKQLEELKAKLANQETANEGKLAQNERLKEELVGLRQACDELAEKLTVEQRAAVASRHRSEELDKQLKESVNQLRQLATAPKTDEAQWQAKIKAALDEAEESKAAWQDEVDRNGRFKAEAANLHQSNLQLTERLAAQEAAAAQSGERIAQLEQQLRERAEAQAKAGPAADSSSRSADTQKLDEELRELRENEAARETELTELEGRLREGVAALARATADLEKERRERRRVEQRAAALTTQLQELHEDRKQHLESEKAAQDRMFELEHQLRQREGEVGRLRSDLQKESSDRQLAEDQAKVVESLESQLQNYRSLFEESKQTFKRSQEELESRIQSSLAAANESENRLHREIAERQRAEEAATAAQRTLQEQSKELKQVSLELSKLQSKLEVEQLERKQLEGVAAQSRQSKLDSTRLSRALTNSLRRQIRQPVDHLLHSARSLLEFELPEDQKSLVEAMFENVLLVQASLQDGGEPSSANTGSAHAPEEPSALDGSVGRAA